MNLDFKEKRSIFYVFLILLLAGFLNVGLTWYVMNRRFKENKLSVRDFEKRLEILEKKIMKEGKIVNKDEQSNIGMPTVSPIEVVEEFYTSYVTGIGMEGGWENSNALTDEFKSDLERKYHIMATEGGGGGVNLILLAQDIPDFMTFEEGLTFPERATVMVNLHFSPIAKRLVSLRLVDGKWKIDAVRAIN